MPMDEKHPLVPSEKDFSFITGRKKREMNYVCCEINPVRLKFMQLKLASQQSRLNLSVASSRQLTSFRNVDLVQCLSKRLH